MATWPDSPTEVARWVAALTSPTSPGVAEWVAEEEASAPVAAAVATAAAAVGPGQSAAPDTTTSTKLVATVDLECGYLRDLVLAALGRRPAWTVVRVDPPPCPDNGDSGGDDSDSDGVTDDQPAPLHPATASSLFHWGEYERIDWARVHAGQAAVSSYCVRKGLTRKAHLAFNLKKWTVKNAATRPAAALLAAALPETHVLQVDDPDYVEEAMADLPEVRDAPGGRCGLWIAKPSLTNRGAGVAVIDSPGSLATALAAADGASEWVVQRYVHPPHLLGGRKWHLRLYVLAVGALEVWAYGGALVLRARRPYGGDGGGGQRDGAAAATAPLADLDAHLTNTCRASAAAVAEKKIQPPKSLAGRLVSAARAWWGGGRASGSATTTTTDPPAATPPPPVTDPVDAGLALSLADLPVALVAENGMAPAEAEARTRALLDAAAALAGETFAAISTELSFFPLPSAWELFGFDFMVDADWRPYLLEVNADPDVGASGEGLKGVVAGLVEGTLCRTADRVAKAAAAGSPDPAVLAPVGGVDEEWDAEKDVSHAWRRVFVRDAGRGAGGGMKVV